jgi:4-amino-4-deoxy-L-arabinose transferase-like glycosyltransferase
MKFKDKLNKVWQYILDRPLFFILLLSLLVRLFYLSLNHPLWWDSHVYIGMAKYIYSSGNLGIWEAFRPLIHPILLGSFWKLGFNTIFIGKLLDLIFSLTSIYLTYLVGKKIFNKNTGLIAALILSITSVFLMFTGLIQTEPLAITFSLLGIYFFADYHKLYKLFLAGIFLALTFLTKFPQGLFFASVMIVLLLRKEKLLFKFKQLFITGIGFTITVLPYLIFNYYRYPQMMEPFTSGSWIVNTATWMYGTGITFYLTQFFLHHWIYLFFFAYIYYFFKEKQYHDANKTNLVLIIILFLAYFSFQVARKEVRYLIGAIPLMAILVAYSLIRIYHKLKKENIPYIRPIAFIVLCTIITVVHIPTTLHFEEVPTFEKEMLESIEKYNITGAIVSSDPAFISYVNNKLIILSSGMVYGPQIYQMNKGKYQLLYLNDCDLICAPNDQSCLKEKEDFINEIKQENKEIFNKSWKDCTFTIYLPIKNES